MDGRVEEGAKHRMERKKRFYATASQKDNLEGE